MNYQSIKMPPNTSRDGHPRQAIGLSPSSPSRASGPECGEDDVEFDPAYTVPPATSARSFTPRALLVGLLIGVLITFSNTYFGLQTGWISTMAMPSALMGFSVFKVLSKHLSYPFTPIENVLIQTVAGAVGTMPLGCGFVGVIPALEFLLREGEDGPSGDGGVGEGGPLKLNWWKLMVWSLGVCLFGVVFAVPLRKETIVREKLKFPSGTASALMLRVLHGTGQEDSKAKGSVSSSSQVRHEEIEAAPPPYDTEESGSLLKDVTEDHADKEDWRAKMRLIIGAFVVSGVYVRPSLLSSLLILTVADTILLLCPPGSSDPYLWDRAGEQLAMDPQPISSVHWARHYHGPFNLYAHALWGRAGMGDLVTIGKVPRLGSRACG